MTSITLAAHFRQRVIRYADKHVVTAAGTRHRVSRNAIYECRAKYDGCWKILVDKSHRPHSHPKQSSKERKPKPYQRASYPGQKVQIDVKFVPSYCISSAEKYCRYTAIDECKRFAYRGMYDVQSHFLGKPVLAFAFAFPIYDK